MNLFICRVDIPGLAITSCFYEYFTVFFFAKKSLLKNAVSVRYEKTGKS